MRVSRIPGETLTVAQGRLRSVLRESAIRIVPRGGKNRNGYLVLFGPVLPGPAVVQELADVVFASPLRLLENPVEMAVAG